MPRRPQKVIKPYVEGWLNQLDSHFETRKKRDFETGLLVPHRRLKHPASAKHFGDLFGLIEGDYLPVLSREEFIRDEKERKQSGASVPVTRREFPSGYCWSIIMKWNRAWTTFQVVRRLTKYVDGLKKYWQEHWRTQMGGTGSPYTEQWIHYDNLVAQHRLIFGEPTGAEHDVWETQFPAVAVMKRIEEGGAACATDIQVLEPLASEWCKTLAAKVWEPMCAGFKLLENNAALRKAGIDWVPELQEHATALYAAALAKDIQQRHERGVAVCLAWINGWGDCVSACLQTLANPVFIQQLQAVLPLRDVSAPALQQKKRKSAGKRRSAKKTRAAKYKENRPKRSAAFLAALCVHGGDAL
jgi:hypothetical protein